MSNQGNKKIEPDQPLIYQIKLEGCLGDQWTAWLDGLSITLDEHGDTLLTGPVVDQAALYGLLRKVRDLGLPLLALYRLQPDQTDVPALQA